MPHRPNSPRRQQGTTLVIGVIMLLLISLLVVAGGRGIVQQTTMAGNSRERDIAFQAAESALRDAESRIPVFHANFTGTGLITTTDTDDIAERSAAAYWMGSAGHGWYTSTGAVDTTKSLQTSTLVTGVDAQPRYVVERLPNGPAPGGIGECGTQTHYRYRVTAIATGASAGSKKSADTRVILQAEYRYCDV